MVMVNPRQAFKRMHVLMTGGENGPDKASGPEMSDLIWVTRNQKLPAIRGRGMASNTRS